MPFAFPYGRGLRAAILLTAMSCSAACHAQSSSTQYSGTVEVGGLKHFLSGGYGDWRHQFLRGSLRTSDQNTWDAEVQRADRFGETGTLLALGNTHQFNDRWYGNAGISGSRGGFFLPSVRIDLALNRKWGERRNLITTVGFTGVNAKDTHTDRTLLFAATYYFQVPLVLQAGLRASRSDPGGINSQGGYAALTYGIDKKHFISLLHSRGNEAYQIIGANALLVDFDSRATTATWRQWLRPHQGFQLRAEAYSNPFYNRKGLELSVFHEF